MQLTQKQELMDASLVRLTGQGQSRSRSLPNNDAIARHGGGRKWGEIPTTFLRLFFAFVLGADITVILVCYEHSMRIW
jgi:hypothetical protein